MHRPWSSSRNGKRSGESQEPCIRTTDLASTHPSGQYSAISTHPFGCPKTHDAFLTGHPSSSLTEATAGGLRIKIKYRTFRVLRESGAVDVSTCLRKPLESKRGGKEWRSEVCISGEDQHITGPDVPTLCALRREAKRVARLALSIDQIPVYVAAPTISHLSMEMSYTSFFCSLFISIC